MNTMCWISPSMEDFEYDRKLRRLEELEAGVARLVCRGRARRRSGWAGMAADGNLKR